MLKSISLKFTKPNQSIVLPAQGITIFVGPNSSGKSLVLKELEAVFRSEGPIPSLKLVSDFDIVWPSPLELARDLERFAHPRSDNPDSVTMGFFGPHATPFQRQHSRSSLEKAVIAQTNKHWLSATYLSTFLVRLDGRTRFELTNDQPMGDLLAPPQTMLSSIFRDNAAREEIRSRVFEAFKQYFVVDPTNLGQARIRIATSPPSGDEQSLNADARRYYSEATYIKEASDGVQAYVGIISAILSGEFRTILIDEPEAFLHPPLARKLGNHLASIASQRSGSLFASTHSADFLMGCVQTTKDVRIVRLEYSNGESSGRVVDPNILETILRSPLMRSANVISALFYDGVVVTESDNDRAFYAEIYYRLSERENNLPSVLFVNAQNKQTIKDIVRPLRMFGIPAAALPDIDILKDGGEVWTNWLRSANIPAALHQGLSVTRHNLVKCFEAAAKDMKRDGGVDALSSDDAAAANKLFDDLDEHGIFVVRRGELETWLPELGVAKKKTDWTVSMLEKMGSDPNSPNYLRAPRKTYAFSAGKKDIWEFMRGIIDWIVDPSRKGTA